jgi:Bacterial membrane protein YfhO
VDHKRTPFWIYLALLADVVLFFHKPLFSPQYLFPWDFRGVQLPPITFLADQLRNGHFALWNPYVYCGFPVFANIEACYFQPFVLLSALIAAHTSVDALPMLLEWMVVLQVWIAGVCAFHVFRRFGAGRAAAFAGAVIFQTGGFFASRAEHIGAMMAVSCMPLAWLAVTHLAERPDRRWLAVLSFALGMSILGGFPQPTLAVFVSVVVLAVLLVLLKMARLRLLLRTAAGCILGILLASVQFIPTTQLTNHSVAKYRTDWLGTGGGLFPQTLVSLVLPNRYHIFDLRQFRGPGDITFLYQYCSIAGLLLAIYALVARRSRYAVLLGILALFGICYTLGDKTAPWRWLYPLLPDKIRIGIHPEYAYCILTMGIAGLAALGLETLRVKEALRWAVAIVIAADLFLVGSGRPMNLISVAQEPGVTRTAFDGSPALLDGVRSRVNLSSPPARVDTVDAGVFWSIAGATTGVPSANGVSPLAPDLIIQLRLFLHDGFRWGWYYPLEKLESPVLDLLNARYVVAGPKAAERLKSVPRFRHVGSLPGNELFENVTVLPRFFLVHRARPVRSLAEARAVIDRREIDFRETALTEEPIPLPVSSEGVDGVKVVDYQPTSLELAVESRGTSLLVASETEYPGWKAWVDGRPEPIHRVDIALRGVVVPSGAHRVRMEFRPMILPVSLGITLATALGLLLLGLRK